MLTTISNVKNGCPRIQRVHSVRRTYKIARRAHVIRKSSPVEEALVNSSYYVGKGIVLFTMFYCSMNWWLYRSVRKDWENDTNNNDDNNANDDDKDARKK